MALLVLAACGGGDSVSDDVKAAAQEHADRHSSGDFAGEWDGWTTEAKAVVSKDDYIAYEDAYGGTGLPIDVDAVRLDDDTTATVRLAIGTFKQSSQMLLEDGDWRWTPQDETLTMFVGGVDAAIAAAKANGSCVED